MEDIMAIFEKMAERKIERMFISPNDDSIEETKWLISAMRAMGHEKVLLSCYPEVGLRSCVAIHDLTLSGSITGENALEKGPIGGVRFYPYFSEKDCLLDVLKLSQAMTKKASAAGLNRGGAKSVIWGDPKTEKTLALLAQLADEVDFLKGKYIAAEDMGIAVSDLSFMRQRTPFVAGLPETYMRVKNGSVFRGSGEPGPITAKGVMLGIKACLKFLGLGDLNGKVIAIQGLGSVGFRLARYAHQEGAELVCCDKEEDRLRHFCEEFQKDAAIGTPARLVSLDAIYSAKCDIFAPCAFGGVLNEKNIEKLDCKIVAGSANNPLANLECARLLKEKRVLYAPDFIINAGGLINVDDELRSDGYNVERVLRRIAGTIPRNLFRVFLESKALELSPAEVAEVLARERIETQKKKLEFLSDMFKKSAIEIARMLENEENLLRELMKVITN